LNSKKIVSWSKSDNVLRLLINGEFYRRDDGYDYAIKINRNYYYCLGFRYKDFVLAKYAVINDWFENNV